MLHEQAILDEILSRLTLSDVRVSVVSLVCDEESLRRRLQKDVEAGLRAPDVIGRSVARLPLYANLRTVRIDVSRLGVEEIAQRILRL